MTVETVDAIVVGAGPNGLAGANVLAAAGWDVLVLEAEADPGGAVRSGEVCEPGFLHDRFSSFYPLAVASAAMQEFALEDWGARFLHGRFVMAHPTREGGCAVLSRDVEETAASVGAGAPADADAWRDWSAWWERIGPPLVDSLFTPFPPVRAAGRLLRATGSPAGLARLARFGLTSVRGHGEREFAADAARRLLAGSALHADLLPGSPGGAVFAWMLTGLGQQVGWPCVEGGSRALTGALVRRLEHHGGQVRCHRRVEEIVVRGGRARGVRVADGTEVAARRAVLTDVGAPALYRRLLRDPLPARVRAGLRWFRYDHATIKVDWSLDGPIPWTNPDAARAPVVHVAEGVEGLARAAGQIQDDRVPDRPFLLVGQYAAVDPSRQPAGRETAWAYTHMSRDVRGDAGPDGLAGRWDEREIRAMADRIEAEIEGLAPGFGRLVRARHIAGPHELEAADANLVGGAINGGTAELRQELVLRPWPGNGRPDTHVERLYLASASAHPGGGVHGACGSNAARAALRHAARS